MYPEVEEYFKLKNAAQWAYDDAYAKIDYDYNSTYRRVMREARAEGREFDAYSESEDNPLEQARRTRQAAYIEADRVLEEQMTPIRTLLLDSEHREVAWIAEHCLFARQGKEVEGHAETILKALPASTDELWEIAKNRHDMCEVFDQFFDDAERDGVFLGKGKKAIAVREVIAFRSFLRRHYGSRDIHQMISHVERILKAARDANAAEIAALKAEYERQDEAYAEARERNRLARAQATAMTFVAKASTPEMAQAST